MDKKSIAIIFGGASTEHEVSIASAKNIANALRKNDIYPIYITRDGEWFYCEQYAGVLNEGDIVLPGDKLLPALLSPDRKRGGFFIMKENRLPASVRWLICVDRRNPYRYR